MILCLFFISFSVVFLILSFFIKYIREISIVSIIVSAVLVGNFLISFTIFRMHNESEFIIGANYNKFNSAKWQKADFYETNQREYMLKDLTKNILPNKNIVEIIDLLGDPYAIVSEGKTYYSYSDDSGDIAFRISNKDENGKHIFYDIIDKNSMYQSEIIKGSMIYYITGPAFMDHSTLDIYFNENGMFKEYKLGIG